jgi:glucose-6-phosphate 1-dehydrogenase
MAEPLPAHPRIPPAVGSHQFLDPFTFVLFGGTGDLATRKLYPSLFHLWKAGWLPERWALVATSRTDMADEAFRHDVKKNLQPLITADLTNDSDAFFQHLYYQRADLTQDAAFTTLATRLSSLETAEQLPGHRLFYLAVAPQLFESTVARLGESGLAREEPGRWRRVVIEKPFGRDLASARLLDAHLRKHLVRQQIYRIDHYLGKDTVQNLLAFRFGNGVFEPLFHREYVDHVQITVAETVGMEGKRGGYYDSAGALRDVVQNHVLQLLALVAMEPPATMKARDVKDCKLQVLRSLKPIRGERVARRVVRAQYTAGSVKGESVKAYREEEGVDPKSRTETFVALRAEVENWRWAGVPFLVRTGKRLERRVTEVAIHFKKPPLQLFRTVECEGDYCDLTETRPNVLAFRVQPDEGITLEFSAKRPGMGIDLQPVSLKFSYAGAFERPLPEAYERLLFDALRGDATLFMRSDELEAAWDFITPILDAWANDPTPLPDYPAGSWGPDAQQLMKDICCPWRRP